LSVTILGDYYSSVLKARGLIYIKIAMKKLLTSSYI